MLPDNCQLSLKQLNLQFGEVTEYNATMKSEMQY